MAVNAKSRRRWLGALFLACAATLFACGTTVLGAHLRGLTFIVYWMVCLLFAVLAMLVALADFRAIAREARLDQHAMLQDAFSEFERKSGPNRPTKPPGGEKRGLGEI